MLCHQFVISTYMHTPPPPPPCCQVTKRRSFHKPTYESLRSSLTAMKAHCVANSVNSLALPRIGCGLDQLSWDRVSEMICAIFKDMEITITVYYLWDVAMEAKV